MSRSDYQKEGWDKLVGWLSTSGASKFSGLLHELADGNKVSREKKEFLGHYKDLLEFHQPKLSRREVSGINDQPIRVSVERAEQIKKALDNL